MVTVQVGVAPLQEPPQPEKVLPEDGVAVRVSRVPELNTPTQFATTHEKPFALTLPDPAMVTESVWVTIGGGGGGVAGGGVGAGGGVVGWGEGEGVGVGVGVADEPPPPPPPPTNALRMR